MTFSISTWSVRDVSFPPSLSDGSLGSVLEEGWDGTGAMPRISEMCAADLDEMFLALIARALWLKLMLVNICETAKEKISLALYVGEL